MFLRYESIKESGKKRSRRESESRSSEFRSLRRVSVLGERVREMARRRDVICDGIKISLLLGVIGMKYDDG